MRKEVLVQRSNFPEKYPSDPLTAFLTSGTSYFDKGVTVARRRELSDFQPFMTFSNGEGQFFFQRNAQKRYLIGADVATGRQVSSEDTDYCYAFAMDLLSGEQVASYMARVTPEQFGLDLQDMGEYYNTAVIAVERTGDGGTTILTLQQNGYSNIYQHKEWNRATKQNVLVEGFPTTSKTRPIALNKLNWHLFQHPEHFWDMRFLNQALTFVRDKKGKPTAIQGAHDDAISAGWIAHGARQVVLDFWEPTSDHREAYINADMFTSDYAEHEQVA